MNRAGADFVNVLLRHYTKSEISQAALFQRI